MKSKRTKSFVACMVILTMVLSSFIPVFSEELSSWATRADMPTARAYFGATEVNGKIYAIGGLLGTTYLKTVEEYDPVTYTWTQKANMPIVRNGLGTAAVNGKIYAIGGYNGTATLKTVTEYDPATNTWANKADMPTARAYLSTAAVNGKVYAIGGSDASYLNTVEEYDPAANTWTAKSSMSIARKYLGTAVVNGKIYAIGGWNGTSYLKTVSEYDPTTNTWTDKADMPTARGYLGTAVVNGKIYAIGGYNGAYLKTVEEYNPVTNTWATCENMPTARYGLGAAAVNNKVYAIGGWDSSYLKTVEEYTPAATATTSDFITPVLTTDMPKYIQNDIVPLALKLKDTKTTDKTNSVTFDIEYDSNTFEYYGSDVNAAVANGYIPFQTKMDLGQGTTKRVSITYLDMDNDISLQENEKVFTVNFKVKSTATAGVKTFTLRPVNMLDTTEKVYNVNNDAATVKNVEIINATVVEGYINLYLGDSGTGLYTDVSNALKQNSINATLNNLKFTLKHNASDTGTVYSGSAVFIPDANGNLATKDANNRIKGKFRIYTTDVANTILTIDGAGYLAKSFNFTMTAAQVLSLNTANAPAELYPGDLGQVLAKQLVMTPDGKINNIDFSAWLKLYKSNMGGTATAFDRVTADFTKDGVVNNVDFSLWLATFKKLAAAGM